ncbi:Williams-Beuren syndrome chromosomal region 27 protein [Arapaima gigas]
MEENTRTFSAVRNVIFSVHKNMDVEDKVAFYNEWAGNYNEDVHILDYRAPMLAARSLSAAFPRDREGALVLDVACGTGLVSAQLQELGFRHFVGVDGSSAMLEVAEKTGLYRELKCCILGKETLPVEAGSCDIVIIVGALSVGHVAVTVLKELWQAAKPGGYVCMTTRADAQNLEYKSQLDCTVAEMEREGLWTRVDVVEEEEWERAVSNDETGYISGVVYLYKKSSGQAPVV